MRDSREFPNGNFRWPWPHHSRFPKGDPTAKFRRGHPQQGRQIKVGYTKNLRFSTSISEIPIPIPNTDTDSKYRYRPSTILHFYFYERLRAARNSSRRNLEPKRAENLRIRFASSAHLLQQTEQKAKIMAERWRQLSKHLLQKIVLSEYNSVSIINMLKASNVEVIRVCFAGCYTKCYHSNERLRAATSI